MVDKIKTAIKEATTNPFTPTASSGGVSVNLLVCLGADAEASYSQAPRQVQLVLNYLFELGGQATIGQLNEFATKSDGQQFWDIATAKPTSKHRVRLLLTTSLECWEVKSGQLRKVS